MCLRKLCEAGDVRLVVIPTDVSLAIEDTRSLEASRPLIGDSWPNTAEARGFASVSVLDIVLIRGTFLILR